LVVDSSQVKFNILGFGGRQNNDLGRGVMTYKCISHGPITPNFLSGSDREIVGDYVEK
jgi:hypothetical protein